MARQPKISTRLSANSLMALGAARLAELLMEAGAGNANLKRRLRLELASEAGPGLLAQEIDKRLTALSIARTRVSWRRRGELLDDLNTHRQMIVERLAPASPIEGFRSLMLWFDLYPSLAGRVKDQKGEVTAAYEFAAPQLFTVASAAGPEGVTELLQALNERPQEYGRWVALAGESLSKDLARQLLDGLDNGVSKTPLGRNLIRRLADRAGDLERWLSLVTPEQAGSPDTAADIARRLLAAGRVPEARAALEAALKPSSANRKWTFGHNPKAGQPTLTPDWERASIDVLDAEGHSEEAQAMRWTLFERDLSTQVLRDYLQRLPDFDDVEALDRAFAHAMGHKNYAKAMAFLMEWPAHREAASLVMTRPNEARHSGLKAADWAARLEQRFPEAAALISN